MNKILKIIGGIFLCIGIIVIGIGVWLKISFDSFIKKSVETTATITSIDSRRNSNGDSSYTVIVEYMVEGKQYTGTLNYYSSSMYIGKQEIIYYDPSNPNKFKSKGGNFVVYIFIILGGFFALIGGIFLLILMLKSKKRKNILSYNYVIQANIIGFNMDTSIVINGRCPYRLEANYINPADGKLYNYRSEEISSDLTPILEQYQIKTIPVYVNPNNFSQYYVDISGIKKFMGN